MPPVPAVAIFSVEELIQYPLNYYAFTRELAQGYPEDAWKAHERLTWDVVLGFYVMGGPRHREDADKLCLVRDAGWDVHAFHELAGRFDEPRDWRYCGRCEDWLAVAIGAEMRAWRMCPACGPWSLG